MTTPTAMIADSHIERSGWQPLSRNQKDLPGRLPSLERLVRLRGVLQRELEFHPQAELAGGDPAEEILRALLQLRARGDVVDESRAREKKRSLLGERLRIEWRHGAA